MYDINSSIVEILKTELQRSEGSCNYSQWVFAVSIKKYRGPDRVIGQPKYTARVVVKTNETDLVDGMDITFTVPENEVLIDPYFFENAPEYQGGSVEDALDWLKKLDDIYYLQIENPFDKARNDTDNPVVQ